MRLPRAKSVDCIFHYSYSHPPGSAAAGFFVGLKREKEDSGERVPKNHAVTRMVAMSGLALCLAKRYSSVVWATERKNRLGAGRRRFGE